MASFAYRSELLPGRVLFGPFLKTKEEVTNLLDKTGVTHIANLMPLSDRVTNKGHPADQWYECYWKHDKNTLRVPTVLRYPVLGVTAKRRDWVAWYTATAQRIAEAMSESTHCVYIHNAEGFMEEAILAFTLCEVLDKGRVGDVDEWIEAHPHSQGVLTNAESRDLLRECLEHLAKLRAVNEGNQGSLKGWVTVRKRAKVE